MRDELFVEDVMIEGNERSVPLGSDFLRVSSRQQDECAKESLGNLARLGVDVRQSYENLGTLLSLLDRFASCFWGCHGREHVVEFLVGRSVSSARGALRLIDFGHYDEALALTRGIVEIGNLVWLFFVQTDELRLWIDATDKERKSRYAPVEVRKAIERAGSVVPHDQTEYAWLCQVAVHPTPDTRPESHNLHGIPTLGGVYQEAGQINCLLRLVWAVASVAGPAAKLGHLDRPQAEAIVEAAVRAVEELPELGEGSEITRSSSAILERTKWVDRNVRKKDEAS